MNNVQPLPKYRVGQSVRMRTDRVIVQSEQETSFHQANTERTVIESRIDERYYTPQLGWIYAIKCMVGLVPEALLSQGSDAADGVQILNDPEEALVVLDVAKMLRFHAEARFKVGDYIRIDADTIDGIAVDYDVYGIVMGVTYIHGELVYDCALKHADGYYVEDELGFGEEDLILVTEQERENLIRTQRVKPKLTMISTEKQ